MRQSTPARNVKLGNVWIFDETKEKFLAVVIEATSHAYKKTVKCHRDDEHDTVDDWYCVIKVVALAQDHWASEA